MKVKENALDKFLNTLSCEKRQNHFKKLNDKPP